MLKITNSVHLLHSEVEKEVQRDDRTCLTLSSESGAELALTTSPLPSSPVPCHLNHTWSFCYNRNFTDICGKEKWPPSQSRLFAEPNPGQGFALQKVPQDWEISTHLGGHFFRIKGASKPQLKSCDTSLKTAASHHGTQHLRSPT